MSDGTTQGGTGSTQGSGQTPPAWYATLDAEHVGHIQTRGWDKLDPAAAALEAIKGHVSATRMVGVPAEQLLRLPKDQTDSEGWRGVWQRLGAPQDPKDYAFEGVDMGESGATNSFVDTLRQTAAALNMPKAMAAEVAKGVSKWIADRVAASDTEIAANVKAGDDAIKTSWGRDYEAHNFVAERGQQALATRLGERLAPQLDQAMTVLREAGLGELGREMMRVVGVGLGEDKFVSGGNSGRPAMTREMAVARKAELMADRQWAGRYVSGDSDARKEMAALNLIAAGE